MSMESGIASEIESRLEQVIALMPQWRDAQGVQISVLVGGLTNQNFRVDVDGESYVVRICGHGTELLGVNRQHEYESSVVAAEVGIGPDVIQFFPELDALVTLFIQGKKIPPPQMTTRENIARVANALKTLHGARRPFPGHFSVMRTVEEYRANAEKLKAPLPTILDQMFAQARQLVALMYDNQGHPALLVPCHNDLLNENFLDDGRIRIIDYEYAGMGDPFFDLGNFAAHHRLTDEQDIWLVESYMESARASTVEQSLARVKLMRMLSDLREALWGAVQINLSKLEIDYRGYADTFFTRFHEPWMDGRATKWMGMLKSH